MTTRGLRRRDPALSPKGGAIWWYPLATLTAFPPGQRHALLSIGKTWQVEFPTLENESETFSNPPRRTW